MPEIWQYHTCSRRRANFHLLFSPFRAMGSWHYWTFFFGKRTIEICWASSGILHEVGRSWTLATIFEPKLRSFVWNLSVCRFGIPNVLIIDNGRQFSNLQFRNFCANPEIDHHLTSVSHLQSNSLAEVTIRIIQQDFRAKISDARGDWSKELLSILWAHRSFLKAATSETLFILAFDLEATIPIEVSHPTLKRLEPNLEGQMTKYLDYLKKYKSKPPWDLQLIKTKQ